MGEIYYKNTNKITDSFTTNIVENFTQKHERFVAKLRQNLKLIIAKIKHSLTNI
ncbi:MAG: hypothetical protein SGJ10_00690 [Bacteroidota bacterium]|nr:hypothetical protein [Bacteroidota bacterium]